MDKQPKPLGVAQTELLDTMKINGGYWYPGCGWTQRNITTTIRTLNSLVKRDLVKVGFTGHGTTYTLTENA